MKNNIEMRSNTALGIEIPDSLLDEVLNNFSGLLKTKVLTDQKYKVAEKLITIAVGSTNAFHESIPAFYSKLLARCVFNLAKENSSYLKKISHDLRNQSAPKFRFGVFDKAGSSAPKNHQSAGKLRLLQEIQKHLFYYADTTKSKPLQDQFTKEFAWIDKMENSPSHENTGTVNIIWSPNSSKKNMLVMAIYKIFAKSFIELKKFDLFMFLGIKEYKQKLNFIFHLVLETNDLAVLDKFLKIYNKAFKYLFNIDINNKPLLLFLIEEEKYEMAFKILEKAYNEKVYFEKRTFDEAAQCVSRINMAYNKKTDEEKTKNPMKRSSRSIAEFSNLWTEGKEQESSYQVKLRKFLISTYVIFTSEQSEAYQNFEDFIAEKDSFFNEKFPFVIEIISLKTSSSSLDQFNLDTDSEKLRIHLIQHYFNKDTTDLFCNYDCVEILKKLKIQLCRLFPKKSSSTWILLDDSKCSINPSENGATFEVVGTSLQIQEIVTILQHPFFQMRRGFDISFLEVSNYIQSYVKSLASQPIPFKEKKYFCDLDGTLFARTFTKMENESIYAYFDISREQTCKLISEKLSEVQDIILMGAQLALTDEKFISYLQEKNLASMDLLNAYAMYKASCSIEITKDIPAHLSSFAVDPIIMQSYLVYETLDKKPENNWPHPYVYKALAKLLNIKLCLWGPGQSDFLIPHPLHENYNLQVENKRIDLILVDGNQSEKLELVISPKVGKSKESPFTLSYNPTFLGISPPHSHNDVVELEENEKSETLTR